MQLGAAPLGQGLVQPISQQNVSEQETLAPDLLDDAEARGLAEVLQHQSMGAGGELGQLS